MEVKDGNPLWTARQRIERSTRKWRAIWKTAKNTGEYDLLDLAEDINVFSLAEYAWDEEGYSMFVLLDARRGK